jgi:hypothetical protein
MIRRNPTESPYRLIYCSRDAILAAKPGADPVAEVNAIVSAARVRNKAANVSGLLLSTGAGFLQVLEGRRDIVERTFDRIAADPRHADVSILSFIPTERRYFGQWPMALCSRLPDDIDDPLETLLAGAGLTARRSTTGSAVLRMLQKLVRRENVLA